MVNPNFERNVFVNCPFDCEYEPLLQAIIFCLIRFGLTPRLATERSGATETRIEKIMELIESAKYSIHDLSRCQSRESGEHYRLNMPFELGLDFGCKKYYGEPYTEKMILIPEEQKYRYQAALSDLAGSYIEAHNGEYATAIRKVRNWLTQLEKFETIGSAKIVAEYEDFQEWNYEKQLETGFSEDDIQDYPTIELSREMQKWDNIRRKAL